MPTANQTPACPGRACSIRVAPECSSRRILRDDVIRLARRSPWLGLTLCLAAAVTTSACESGKQDDTRAASAASAGFTRAGLEQLHAKMAGYVDQGLVPGMVMLLERRGQVHIDAIGNTAIDGPPMQRDTIFRIASMSKPVTAVAALMLVEEGKLDLDEPVDRLLPELAARRVLRDLDGPLDATVPAERAITVRDLLTLTMGFGIMLPFDAYPVQRKATELSIGYGPPEPKVTPEPDEWLRRLGTLPLMYQPGARWVYNTGADVLGVLVARASGQPFDAFLRARIFEPLGMSDTDFSVPPAKLERLSTSYFPNPESGALDVFDGVEGSAWGQPPAFPSGAGGLVSTVDDFMAFAQMLLKQGEYAGGRLLTPESVAQMTSDQLTPEQKAPESEFSPDFWATHGWGFGVSVITQPDAVSANPGRYGWDGGLGTYWFSDPDEDFAGVLLTQRALDPSSPANDFWPAAYQAFARP